MATRQVKLPDIGEGLVEGEIVEWLVKEGDYVKMFQPIVRVLTAKATVEIPSPFEGKVLRLLAKPGDVVRVEAPIAEIEVSEGRVVAEAPETPVLRGLKLRRGHGRQCRPRLEPHLELGSLLESWG